MNRDERFQTAQALMKEGQLLLGFEPYERALVIASQIVAGEPVSDALPPEIWEAVCKSVEKFTAALELEPNLVDAQAYRARAHRALKNTQQAEEDARRVWESRAMTPLSEASYLDVALSLKVPERMEVMRYRVAEEGRPMRYGFWGMLCTELLKQGDLDGCAVEYKAMIEDRIETGHLVGLWQNLFAWGDVLQDSDEYLRAETVYKRCIDMIPLERQAMEKQIDELKTTDLEKAKDLDELKQLWFERQNLISIAACSIVNCRLRSNDFSGALSSLNEFKDEIDDLRYRSLRALALWLSGQPVDVEAIVRDLEMLSPDRRRNFHLGLLYYYQGRSSEAIPLLSAFLKTSRASSKRTRWESGIAESILAIIV